MKHREESHVSVPQQLSVMIIGGILVALGGYGTFFLIVEGFRWEVAAISAFLILEGCDCLYAGVSGRNGGGPCGCCEVLSSG
jgi:hypothetical protein